MLQIKILLEKSSNLVFVFFQTKQHRPLGYPIFLAAKPKSHILFDN